MSTMCTRPGCASWAYSRRLPGSLPRGLRSRVPQSRRSHRRADAFERPNQSTPWRQLVRHWIDKSLFLKDRLKRLNPQSSPSRHGNMISTHRFFLSPIIIAHHRIPQAQRSQGKRSGSETSRRFQASRREEKIGCGAEPALSERSESNGRLLELWLRGLDLPQAIRATK